MSSEQPPDNGQTAGTAQTAGHTGPSSAFELTVSRQFPSWLTGQQVSLAFTTYQSNRLILVGLKADGSLSVFQRTFPRSMGLWGTDESLWMSSQFQTWRLENVLRHGPDEQGFDRLYVPRVGYVTGSIDVHDLAVQEDGRVVFINTLFGCLATLSETDSFEPLWQPPFLSRLAAEDRCHLNGLAMRDGTAAFVTACGTSDVVDGWRDTRDDGGVVIDIASSEIVARGLSMPHSPRWYRDRLWLLNSGTGDFGYVDLPTGQFQPVAFCPGYARGLTFVGKYAVIGLSEPRHEMTFSGLRLDHELTQRGSKARCGLIVIDLETGDAVHWLRLEGTVQELYDVVALPGVQRPQALGFQTDEIQNTVTARIENHTRIWSGIPK